MLKQLKTFAAHLRRALLSHRALYGGLAAAYAADCLWGVDKDLVAQAVMSLYLMLAIRG